MPSAKLQSPNFGFLKNRDPQLMEYAARAERYVLDDPNTTLLKLRQFAEDLAEDAAAYNGIDVDEADGFGALLRELRRKDIITHEMADIFHGLRKAGNRAAHEGGGSRQEAVAQLKMARRLAVWYHQAFHEPGYRPGAFVLPPAPRDVTPELKAELERLRKERWDHERRADETEEALKKARREQQVAEAWAEKMFAELETALALAGETEIHQSAMARKHGENIARLRAGAKAASDEEIRARNRQAQQAAQQFDLTEGEARERIDAQLRARGWEADSVVRTWQHGARPQDGRNMAIAFCPAGDGYADYGLFLGRTVAGIIEAKRRNHDLRAALDEAGVHSRAYTVVAEEVLPEGGGNGYRVPLLFASNGRPFTGASDTLSGVWFRDVRGDDTVQALADWPTPERLRAML